MSEPFGVPIHLCRIASAADGQDADSLLDLLARVSSIPKFGGRCAIFPCLHQPRCPEITPKQLEKIEFISPVLIAKIRNA